MLEIDGPRVHDPDWVLFLTKVAEPNLEVLALLALEVDVLVSDTDRVLAHADLLCHGTCNRGFKFSEVRILGLLLSEFEDEGALCVTLEPVLRGFGLFFFVIVVADGVSS